MKTPHALFAIVLTVFIMNGSTIAAPSIADKEGAGSDWLAIPVVYEKVIAAGYSSINKIERERDGYKIKAYDRNGDRVKLFVDPVNGEVFDVRAMKNKSDKYRDEHASNKRDRYDILRTSDTKF